MLCHGDRASVWEDEKVLEMEGGDGCKPRGVRMPRNCTLKNGENAGNAGAGVREADRGTGSTLTAMAAPDRVESLTHSSHA